MKLYVLALLTLLCAGEAFAANGCDDSSDGDSDADDENTIVLADCNGSHNNRRGRRGLSGGAIAGIVIGILALLSLIILILFCWRRRAMRASSAARGDIPPPVPSKPQTRTAIDTVTPMHNVDASTPYDQPLLSHHQRDLSSLPSFHPLSHSPPLASHSSVTSSGLPSRDLSLSQPSSSAREIREDRESTTTAPSSYSNTPAQTSTRRSSELHSEMVGYQKVLQDERRKGTSAAVDPPPSYEAIDVE